MITRDVRQKLYDYLLDGLTYPIIMQSEFYSRGIMYSECQSQLRVGDQHVITLPEMGAAGYEWFFEISNDKIDVTKKPGNIPPIRDSVGGPVLVTFELSAISEGRSRVVFEQSRPWERNDVAATHVLQIEILP